MLYANDKGQPAAPPKKKGSEIEQESLLFSPIFENFAKPARSTLEQRPFRDIFL